MLTNFYFFVLTQTGFWL